MTLEELKRKEKELREKYGDDLYEKLYMQQYNRQKATTAEMTKPPAYPAAARALNPLNQTGKIQPPEASGKPQPSTFDNKIENTFYTSKANSGIMPNNLKNIQDFRGAIEDLDKRIADLNKEQFNTMLTGDGKKTEAFDSLIKNTESIRDSLKEQLARVMRIGSESADKDMLRKGGDNYSDTASQSISTPNDRPQLRLDGMQQITGLNNKNEGVLPEPSPEPKPAAPPVGKTHPDMLKYEGKWDEYLERLNELRAGAANAAASGYMASPSKLLQDIKGTYQQLLKMNFDEKSDFVFTDDAAEYFKNLDKMSNLLKPEESRKYQTVLFGDSDRYEVVDGEVIVKTPPELNQIKQGIESTYQQLLKMSFDEQADFIRTNEAKKYFWSLESAKDHLTPDEKLKYRTVLFGVLDPYAVVDGDMIVKTEPDPTDPDSAFWNTHKMPEDFDPTDPHLEDATLRLEYLDLHPAEYNDKSTGETVQLPKGSYKNIAQKAYARYHDSDSIGSKLDPYSNLISVLKGEGLEPGDNLLVEYAKTFVGKLYYGDEMGGTNLADHADCSGFVHCIYRDFGISIPRGTSNLSIDAEKYAYEGLVKDTSANKKYIKGPCMGKGRNSMAFSGTKEAARQAIKDFCDELKPGDLILFDLGSRNGGVYGDVNHVVMYAGNGMIVEEPNKRKYARYHPIEELIFNNEDSRKTDYWKTRLPVYALSYLTEQRKRFTVPEE